MPKKDEEITENIFQTHSGIRKEYLMRKRGWILLLILLMVAFLMSCGKKEEPDGGIGELVRIQWEGATEAVVPSLFFFFDIA